MKNIKPNSIWLLIAIAFLSSLLAGCGASDVNPLCSTCPIAPLLAIGLFIISKR
ncbi:MAG: hypothetical protein HON98_11855 [Chloroflexi bacterium]|jgi:hypothetical protein|nr:hypothetical protein [Chloroflexota bacterium]MBT3669308.1 hypothetical protein [Chloroflexota bacterium]MBT4003493.1 hypothetical protein [Chloroflexota bacterium]MBT4306015.1 hypothetical protein [Chloroflexota bacterium]MBT4532659.1 hypothetical protein [Chloroflexota bacterium]